jgi:anaerobic magnesium-protoporphyrin IX monomethyl ester cyclase
MINICLLNPPYFPKFSRSQRSPGVTKSGTLYYPMWLAYATGVLEKQGYPVQLIDCPADNIVMDDLIKRILLFNPQMIIIDTCTPSILNDTQVCNTLKELMPNTIMVMVGTHVSALGEETLNTCTGVDIYCFDEYDYTVLDLARWIDNGKHLDELEKIPGIGFRKDGKPFKTQHRTLIADLDELPFVSEVYKKHLKIENYFNPNALPPMVTILSSRGCPYQCIWCIYPQTVNGQRVRNRSIPNVVAELEYIEKAFPEAKSVFFEDDTLTANKKRCKEMADLIQQKGIKLSWTANARADVDFETLVEMRRANCRMLCTGFESGNQTILNNMKKGITIEKAKQFMKDARKAGILVHGCFMAGNPGETKDTLYETLQYAMELNPDTAQFYPVMVYPGTEAYEWYRSRGYLNVDDYSQWLTEEGLHNTVIDLPGLPSRYLVEWCDMARKKFYLRPQYIASKLRQVFTHPEEIGRLARASRTFAKYLFRGTYHDKKYTRLLTDGNTPKEKTGE